MRARARWIAVASLLPCCAAAGAAEYGPVRPGETLWQVAGRVDAGGDLDRNQIMLALLRANPQAFTPSCNVNAALRVGTRLRVPTAEEIAAVDPAAARQAIADQARDWAGHRRGGRPLDCAVLAAGPSGTVAAQSTPPAADAPPPPTPSKALPSGPAPAPAALCPCPTGAATGVAAGPVGFQGPPVAAGEATPQVPPGPRAPGWFLAVLALGLLAFAFRRPGGGRGAADAASREGTGGPPGPAVLHLVPGLRNLYLLLVLAALAGVLGAAVTVLFREAITGIEALLGGQGSSLVVLALTLSPWERLLLPTFGGLAAGLILQEIGGRLRGRTTTDYMEAVAAGDGWISIRQSLVKGASSLCTVASGGSIGREGAMVQLAAMVASTLGRLACLPRDHLRLLVAAGAAAGLAAAYNAPLAATIFVAEIVLGSIALEHIGPLIVAAVIASVTVHDLLGYAPAYQIPAFHLVSSWELGLYLLLGLIAGHTAPVFLRLLERSTDLFTRLPLPLAGRLTLGGLIVGLVSVYEPQVWGKGYTVVDSVLLAPWAWQALATVLLLKVFTTAVTLGSGGIGGAFTPTLFVGALQGALFGTLVQTVLPVGTAPPSAYAVVGMGAMLAATTQAPLMSILMIIEMTMDYQIVLPLMLSVVIAHYTALRYTGVRPMYAESLLPQPVAVLTSVSAGAPPQ
ncbi:ClcB-like voltage-gated chloride channel protein [Candidatus Thiodictyon syntrophicum]|jgi:FimV-like protein|uniref:Fimbrial protein FimV n=1 Tax=Candidatus Thiodictyon syntrophicum TaxID=1166950 RepID=A0A2K8UDX8_9GAMM|nr:ClcB-like voltage-gated chloride channel protein [Candidatus Thiodictyon syntrophicum]AUB83803.1 fimbrial protein FimV [Candidatus Thiodictyon syntrophicum]